MIDVLKGKKNGLLFLKEKSAKSRIDPSFGCLNKFYCLFFASMFRNSNLFGNFLYHNLYLHHPKFETSMFINVEIIDYFWQNVLRVRLFERLKAECMKCCLIVGRIEN